MNFIIRVDDYPFALVNDPRVDWNKRLDNLKRFDDIMRVKGCQYLLGVVPAHIMSEDVALFKDRNINVALHGYDHHHLRVYEEEFRDKFIEKTALLFKTGLDKLTGIPVRGYICPFNEYDERLPEVLRKVFAGHITIYGGNFITGVKKEFHGFGGNGYRVIQPISKLYGTSDNIIKEIGEIEEDGREFYCLTLHWTWEINYLQMGIKSLEKLLDRVSGKCLSYAEVINR